MTPPLTIDSVITRPNATRYDISFIFRTRSIPTNTIRSINSIFITIFSKKLTCSQSESTTAQAFYDQILFHIWQVVNDKALFVY